MQTQFKYFVLVTLTLVQASTFDQSKNEINAIEYLQNLEGKYSDACNKQIVARWNYITNVTNETEQISVEATNKFSEFQASVQQDILTLFPDWSNFKNKSVKMELNYLKILGPGNTSKEDVAQMNKIQGNMESAYAKATVCEYQNPQKCNLFLEPEIENKLEHGEDYDELAYYWTSWHDKLGSEVSASEYAEFIAYQNKIAVANGFNDMSELTLEQYRDGTPEWTASKFKEEMASLWITLEPYYRKLHSYVRKSLMQNPQYLDKFNEARFEENLPAHVFGNMWAQQWGALENSTQLFPQVSAIDVTSALIKKGYTETKIFEVADEFFGGMGLERMTPTFWGKSMLVKPTGREVVCHASAEDMCTGKGNQDFRIKMCTKVTFDSLVTAHHEMGHIEYFMQYTNEHFIFRNGANPGFHEAIGDALALAVITPKHLQCILNLDLGLEIDCNHDHVNINDNFVSTPTDINFLYLMALDKIAFLPFAYSVDRWRWEVFEGKLLPENYNSRWWEIRKMIQHIVPPVPRNSTFFDPAAKYHIVGNVEYIRYFISHILQFQFYEAMCIAANEYIPGDNKSKPLYKCDFSGNKEAGKKLAEMMSLGFSKPWPEALEILTGSRQLSTASLVNYFSPLWAELDKRID